MDAVSGGGKVGGSAMPQWKRIAIRDARADIRDTEAERGPMTAAEKKRYIDTAVRMAQEDQ